MIWYALAVYLTGGLALDVVAACKLPPRTCPHWMEACATAVYILVFPYWCWVAIREGRSA